MKSATTLPEVIPLPTVAERYGLSPRTVASAAWRRRAGLRVTRIGKRIVGVTEEDLRAAMRRDSADGFIPGGRA